MASTTFTAGTVIPSTWLNDVNALVWGSTSPPGTPIRVTTTGNVGIGVTPNANWRADAVSLQSGPFTTMWTQANGSANIGFGVYEGGTNTFNYLTTGDAPTLYSQISGRHLWYKAGAGTAGGSISFTKVLELDASGNFISNVNTSAPSLADNNSMTFSLTSNTNLRISVRGSDGVTRVANITLA